jgi:two-component system, OmpR family, phosphate regulon response regulator PhoB
MNLLLLEDDTTLGETLRDRLQREGYSVTLCRDIKTAREKFEVSQYNLVIVDVGLPDGSGFDFAKVVRRKSTVPFIFVTAQSAAEDRLRGYELGAEEYIPKPFHLREFLLRVKHVLANHVQAMPLKVDSVLVDLNSMTIKDGDNENALNRKEAAVLKILMERAPQVVSRDELLDAIWGENEYPSNRTVDNIVVRLRSLLGDAAKRIVSVRGIGYKWTDGVRTADGTDGE